MKLSEKLAGEIASLNVTVQAALAKGADATDEQITAAETAIAEIDGLEKRRAAAVDLESKAAASAASVARFDAETTRSAPFAAKAVAGVAETKGPMLSLVPRERTRHLKSPDEAYALGAFVFATLLGNAKMKGWCESTGLLETKVHQEGNNATGGFLVPSPLDAAIIDLRESYGVFRRNAKVSRMTSDTLSVNRRTAGLTAYAVGESAAITESTKGWDQIQLVARRWGCLARISSELNEDAITNIGDDLAGEMAYAFANKEDECGFNGDGTATYHGIQGIRHKMLNLSATRANIAGLVVGAGNAFSEITLANFHEVMAKLPEYAYGKMPKWYASVAFAFNVMQRLAFAAGGVTSDAIISGTKGGTFLGYPVEISQVFPKVDTNDVVLCLFGDLALSSTFGDRRGTTFALSTDSRFANDEIEIRATTRFDINVHDVGNQSSTAADRVPGPVVGLLSAAS